MFHGSVFICVLFEVCVCSALQGSIKHPDIHTHVGETEETWAMSTQQLKDLVVFTGACKTQSLYRDIKLDMIFNVWHEQWLSGFHLDPQNGFVVLSRLCL